MCAQALTLHLTSGVNSPHTCVISHVVNSWSLGYALGAAEKVIFSDEVMPSSQQRQIPPQGPPVQLDSRGSAESGRDTEIGKEGRGASGWMNCSVV